jgi:hypothetical protein
MFKPFGCGRLDVFSFQGAFARMSKIIAFPNRDRGSKNAETLGI